MRILSPKVSVVSTTELFGAKRIDSEFYQQEYIENESIVDNYGAVEVLGDFADSVRKGIFDIKASEYQSDGIPFLRIGDLEEGYINWDKCTYITHERSSQEIHSRLNKWDIVLSKTARPGVAIIDKDVCNVSQDLIALKTGRSKEYNLTLCAYLLGRYGNLAMRRLFQGNIQMHLSLTDTKKIKLPIFPLELQRKVAHMFEDALDTLRNAETLYPEAEQELLERLQWDRVTSVARELCYIESASNLVNARRSDAEHFQPKYYRLSSHLMKLGAKRIIDFCEMPFRGVQPSYIEDGEVWVVNSKHLGQTGIDVDNLERTSKQFYNTNEASKARLKFLDVLLYATGAYVGRTNTFMERHEAIASNHVTIIRPNPEICNPVYLSLFLNSSPGLLQSEQYATGSAQRELYPSEIARFLVYVPKDSNDKIDLGWQEYLADKVIRAYNAKSDAIKKFDAAKKMVELAIKSNSCPKMGTRND